MNLKTSLVAILFACVFAGTACQNKNPDPSQPKFSENAQNGIRTLDSDERSADFDQLLQLFKSYYGPYQYKEKRFGLNIEKMIMDLKQQALAAKTDEEFFGYLMQVAANLRDGHVQFQIENSASNVRTYRIPILLANIENKAIVADISEDLSKWTGIKLGDEILSIDGQDPQALLQSILKYRKAATDLSDKSSIIYAFLRPSYMTDLVPAKPEALVSFVNANGVHGHVEISWENVQYSESLPKVVRSESILDLRTPFADDFNSVVPDSHRGQMGQVEPIFLNPTTQAKYKFVRVFPTAETMKKFGLKGDERPGIYAALYRYAGKSVLLLRSSSYSQSDFPPEVYLKTYRAIIAEYQDLADVMVLDQTHNPGGSYCGEFYDLFARDGDVNGTEYVHADRKWINDLYVNWPAATAKSPGYNPWDVKQLLSWGAIVEKAYDNKQFLSEPFPLFTGSVYARFEEVRWTKPMLVLIDELAGSCGDIYPMLVKANKRAPMFGQKTMGLGGNVEPVGQLNHTRLQVRMTRGMFLPFKPVGDYQESEFVENNGVTPDIEYTHTVKDFRNGYLDYVKTFSDKAVTLQ